MFTSRAQTLARRADRKIHAGRRLPVLPDMAFQREWHQRAPFVRADNQECDNLDCVGHSNTVAEALLLTSRSCALCNGRRLDLRDEENHWPSCIWHTFTGFRALLHWAFPRQHNNELVTCELERSLWFEGPYLESSLILLFLGFSPGWHEKEQLLPAEFMAHRTVESMANLNFAAESRGRPRPEKPTPDEADHAAEGVLTGQASLHPEIDDNEPPLPGEEEENDMGAEAAHESSVQYHPDKNAIPRSTADAFDIVYHIDSAARILGGRNTDKKQSLERFLNATDAQLQRVRGNAPYPMTPIPGLNTQSTFCTRDAHEHQEK